MTAWTPADARDWIAVPEPHDDKYSRGVLGVVTGSREFPGAAVLTVEAALHTGLGMVRYVGPEEAAGLVLARCPEAVTVRGRVDAWLAGSGMVETSATVAEVLAEGLPAVLDAGALGASAFATGPVVMTPHAGELARLLDVDVAEVRAEPTAMAVRAATRFGATVMLKGHTTTVCTPGGELLEVTAPSSWLATAGTGDALAGILGALVVTHARRAHEEGVLARFAATASVIHSLAGERAGAGGPFTVRSLIAAVPLVVAELLT